MDTKLTIKPAPEVPKTGDSTAPILQLVLMVIGIAMI